MNIELLIKVLNLTTSDNDGEALSAMRKANAILKTHGVLWDSVLKAPASAGQQKRSSPERTESQSDDLTKMNYLMQECILTPWEGEFVNTIRAWRRRHGYLTPKQRHVFDKVYRKHKNDTQNR